MSSDGAPASRPWSDEVIRDLLTQARLRSYLSSSNQDLVRALELYEWNLAASAAVMQTSAMVEVIVRNALDTQLADWSSSRGAELWTETVPLDQRGQGDIARAVNRATDYGRMSRSHGKVVAELNFGFWRYLTASRYHASLWVPALHRAFPGGDQDLRVRRRLVERHLSDLILVRNRVAHHEPIHRRNLMADLDVAVELTTWIHPDAGMWVRSTSAIPTAVAKRPVPARR